MQDNLTPEQQQSVAWDEVLIAHNSLADAVAVMVNANTTLTMFAAMDAVRDRHSRLREIQQHYWNTLAGAA